MNIIHICILPKDAVNVFCLLAAQYMQSLSREDEIWPTSTFLKIERKRVSDLRMVILGNLQFFVKLCKLIRSDFPFTKAVFFFSSS